MFNFFSLHIKKIYLKFLKKYWRRTARKHLLKPSKNWNYEVLLLLVTSTIKELNFEFLVCIVSNSTTTLTKVYTRRTFDKIVTPQSCFSDLLPGLNNTITGKGFNLFYEYAVRCIHLSPS